MSDLDAIQVTQGSDGHPTLTITKDGDPLNLTGMTVTWAAKSNHDDAAPVLGPYTAVITDAPAGKCRVDIPDADTADLTKPAYLWDAKVTAGADEVAVARGVLHVLEAVH